MKSNRATDSEASCPSPLGRRQVNLLGHFERNRRVGVATRGICHIMTLGPIYVLQVHMPSGINVYE